jgi:hypothetical protein
MKKQFLFFICLLPIFILSCVSTPQVSNLVSLEKAITNALSTIEGRTQTGDTVAVVKINTPLPLLSDFISNKLDNSFNTTGKLAVVVRGKNLQNIIAEQNFQLSGL